MGLGKGEDCERCGEQLQVGDEFYVTKYGEEIQLCEDCIKELRKEEFDKEHS